MLAKALITHLNYASKWEDDYAKLLDLLFKSGNIRHYAYEPITLRLAKKTGYTPDFMVIKNDGTIEFHEVKGFRREDAIVKLKIAARQFPMFRFLLTTYKKGQGFITEPMPPHEVEHGESE